MNTLLLYWLLSSASVVPATGTATFADAQACQTALAALQRSYPGESGGACVPQATAQDDGGQPGPVSTPTAAAPPGAPTKAVAPKHGP